EEDIRSLPLPSELKSRLLGAGLCLLAARLGQPLDQCRRMQLTVRDALARCTNDGGGGCGGFRLPDTAETLLLDVARSRASPACRPAWDRLLQGACRSASSQNWLAVPARARPSCAWQLCASVQLPAALGGLQGGAVYLDTEGSFSPRRQAQIALRPAAALPPSGRRMRQRRLPPGDDDDGNGVEGGGDGGDGPLTKEHLKALNEVSSLTVEQVMSNIYYFRCLSHVQLCAFAHESLERFLVGHPHVRLIVLDSIASPFRYEFDNAGQRNRQLAELAALLTPPGRQLPLAVLCTNQMTTRFGLTDAADSRVEPALGPSWCHVCNIRLGAGGGGGCEDQRRRMRVLKHPAVRAGSSAVFQVCAVGVRDAFQDDVS
uniref:DNA repair protein RAD51 homolog 3 n=1 Tax=Macrostomum lignano TaxID=282301 RepID=A0A1I8F3F8_9PLAT